MSEERFEINIQDLEKMPMSNRVYGGYLRPSDAWDGEGVEGVLELVDDHCGIDSASGTIGIRPLWKKEVDGKLIELFEGNFIFKAKFSSMYSRKGFGKSMNVPADFWAVRALE